jgi:hypothetical protein
MAAIRKIWLMTILGLKKKLALYRVLDSFPISMAGNTIGTGV